MRLSLGLLGMVLLACGSKPPVTDGTDSGNGGQDSGVENDSGIVTGDSGNTETGDTEQPLVPEQGNYKGMFTEVLVDECDFALSVDSSVDLWWILDGADVDFYSLDGNYNVVEGPCSFEDNSFSCVLYESKKEAEDLDAVVTTLLALNGSWTDETSIHGSYDATMECVGADCDAFLADAFAGQDVPCTSSIGFKAKWTEEEIERPVTPEEGDYTGSFGTVSSDECGLNGQGYQAFIDEMTLHFTYGSRFLLEIEFYGDMSDPITCTRMGPTFSCQLSEEVEHESKDYDAVISSAVEIVGEWVAPTKMAGDMNYTYDCVGTECAAYAKSLGLDYPVPCSTVAPFSASKQ